jgi:hypothetical protein
MKKNFGVTFSLLAFCTIAGAQKIEESKVAEAAKQSFIQKYPGLTGKWEKENDNYEVSFKKDGKSMSAVIDSKGAILETETDIAIKDLPAEAASYIKSHYKGAVIKEAAEIIKANGDKIFEAEVNKKDILFDAAGKYLKEAKD